MLASTVAVKLNELNTFTQGRLEYWSASECWRLHSGDNLNSGDCIKVDINMIKFKKKKVSVLFFCVLKVDSFFFFPASGRGRKIEAMGSSSGEGQISERKEGNSVFDERRIYKRKEGLAIFFFFFFFSELNGWVVVKVSMLFTTSLSGLSSSIYTLGLDATA